MNYSLSIVLVLLIIPISITTVPAFGFGQNDTTCYERGDCDFFARPFDTMILPYTEVFGAFTFLLIWSVIIGILWLRLGNTMAVGIIGLTLAVVFNDPTKQLGIGFSEDAQLVGYLLLFLAIGIVLFQLFTVRTQYPTN